MKQKKEKKTKKVSELTQKEIQKQLTEKLVKAGVSADFLAKHFFVVKVG
jgi:hypothetical protein